MRSRVRIPTQPSESTAQELWAPVLSTWYYYTFDLSKQILHDPLCSFSVVFIIEDASSGLPSCFICMKWCPVLNPTPGRLVN